MDFSKLDLSPQIQAAISKKGYQVPTAIQQEGITAILSGQDVMAAAKTRTSR